MSKHQEVTRREFLRDGAITGAGLAAYSGISFITDPAKIFGANDRIRFGVIGCGDRAQENLQAALKSPNVECAAVADVYTRRLDEIRSIVPNAKPYRDFRRMLDDKTIDAVVVVTPQAPACPELRSVHSSGQGRLPGKDHGLHPDHARRMRRAFEGSGRVVQVGIQSVTSEVLGLVKSLNTPENMGDITALHTHMYRNAPYGGWKQPIPSDCDLEHVDWKEFQGEAVQHEWDPTVY